MLPTSIKKNRTLLGSDCEVENTMRSLKGDRDV